MRQGTAERLGVDYTSVREVNASIIYASISGYGPSGPWKQRAGYDMIAGAEAGLMHLVGERGGRPVRPGLGFTDMSTGLFMHGAITAALYSRKETGVGQRIDGSLFESQVALLTNVALTWLNLGQEAERWGAQHPSVVPYDSFETKDLYFVCGAVNNKQFEKLCQILNVPQLLEDSRFESNSSRVANRDELMPHISKAFKARSASEWMKEFEGSGMPYAPINTMEKVFSHPQTAAREMIQDVAFEPARSGRMSLLGQ
jgi:succinate---hydroxymethylglutarate CoA-transferase